MSQPKNFSQQLEETTYFFWPKNNQKLCCKNRIIFSVFGWDRNNFFGWLRNNQIFCHHNQKIQSDCLGQKQNFFSWKNQIFCCCLNQTILPIVGWDNTQILLVGKHPNLVLLHKKHIPGYFAGIKIWCRPNQSLRLQPMLFCLNEIAFSVKSACP